MSDAPGPAKPKRERTGWFTELRRAIDGPLLWFGVFVGAASGISAIARLLDVGLFGVFRDFVEFYRALLRPIYDLVNLPPWPFHVPELAVDLLAVYVVLVRMSQRATALSIYELSIYQREGREGEVVAERTWKNLSLGEKFFYSLKSLLLLPVITLAPLRDFRRIHVTPIVVSQGAVRLLMAHTPAPPAYTPSRPSFDQSRYNMRSLRRQSIVSFIALPAAIIIFFVLNAYAPGPN